MDARRAQHKKVVKAKIQKKWKCQSERHNILLVLSCYPQTETKAFDDMCKASQQTGYTDATRSRKYAEHTDLSLLYRQSYLLKLN